MIVIVGHGPSIVGKGLGPWLDEQFVVRLKRAEKPNAKDWGTRTDVICATSHIYRQDEVPFWWFPKHNQQHGDALCRVADTEWWRAYFAGFSRTKGPSTGLSAIFCAVEFLHPERIALAGFDNLLYPDERGYTKWWHARYQHKWDADSAAEHKAAFALGIEIIDATRVYGRTV